MVASAKAKKYWDRILVKTLTKEQRLQVEGYLAQDEPLSNKGIAVALGWPVRMRGSAGPIVITAVKRNPIPGGKCDPHGERAAELGFWIEPVSGAKGIKRPWLGFGEDGRPIIGEDMQELSSVQIESMRERARGILSDTQKTRGSSNTPGSLKARRRERREDAARVSAGTMTQAEYADKWLRTEESTRVPLELESPAAIPPTGIAGVGSSPASPPRPIEDGATTAPVPPPPTATATASATAQALPPRRIHGPGVTSNSLKHVGQGTGGKQSRRMLLGKTRKLTRKHLPLEERIELLAWHARNKAEPQVSFRALQELNTMDGLTAAVKDAGDAQQGSTPLFALPTTHATGPIPALLMGVAPVKPSRPANTLPQDAETVEAGGQEQFSTDEEAGE